MTVLFADMSGSTALGERLDPEALRSVIERYFDAMKAEIERHGGTVEKFIGDAVMAVFGLPVAHEDDALRAVRAARGVQQVIGELNAGLERDHGAEIRMRIGINTGEVVSGDARQRQRLVTGDTVNVAARFEQTAPPGEILIGRPTWRLVRDAVTVEALEPLALKGKSVPVPAFRVTGLVKGAAPIARRTDTTFVGRELEREVLRAALDRVLAEGTCHLVTVLGTAGVGKSRLVAEVLRDVLDQVQIYSGRCLPYGDGITFWPVLEIVKAAARITETEDAESVRAKLRAQLAAEQDAATVEATLAAMLGLAPGGRTLEETFWAVRRYIESLAGPGPVVLVIDDLHWATPSLLDLIEHIADRSRDEPILLVGLARRELLDQRPAWGAGERNASTISLEPLDERDASSLVQGLLEVTDLPGELTARIVRAAEGNPLFVEELLAMLVDDGVLVHEVGGWRQTKPLYELELPGSIQALLAARLDQLESSELRVIESGAVVGQVFYRAALAELAPQTLAPDVGIYLRNLVRKDLVRPEPGGFQGDETYRFRHILIRDAAYRAMPKRIRAELHERFADWLERTSGERLAEFEEIAGYHLEQAAVYRGELGQKDDHVVELRVRAGTALLRAGHRATGRGDSRAAAGWFRRASTLLPPVSADRIDALCELADALDDLAELEDAVRAMQDAATAAEGLGDESWTAYVRLLQEWGGGFSFHADTCRALARAAIDVLTRRGSRRRLARSWSVLGATEWLQNRSQDALAAWARVIETAGDDPRLHALALECYWNRANALLFGETPRESAIATIEQEILPVVRDYAVAAAGVRGLIGELRAMGGDFEQGRMLIEDWLETLRTFGFMGVAANLTQALGRLYLMQGDLEAAREVLQDAVQECVSLGFRNELLDAYLSDVEYRRGDYQAATKHMEDARDSGETDFLAAEIEWRSLAALLAARGGETTAALGFISDVDRMLAGTGFLYDNGQHLLRVSEAMELLGDHDAALEAAHRAHEMFDRKGVLPEVERARARIQELENPGPG